MEMIAIFMFGAIFGIFCTLFPKLFEKQNTPPTDESPAVPSEDERQKRLQEQWEAFLNYSGDDVGGGLVDE